MTTSEHNPFGFPHPELTRIVGRRDAQSIKLLRKELYANAMIVPASRGGGANGHLGLLMPNAPYFLRAGEHYIAPNAPGVQTAHLPNATSAQILEANRQFDKNSKEYSIHASITASLRNQQLLAVDGTYYKKLEDDEFGYVDVSPKAILVHPLTTHYGTRSSTDLEDNRGKLKSPWSPDDEIKTLWTRVSECRNFAAGTTEEITDDILAMRLLLIPFEKVGVLTLYVSEWNRKATVDKTYPAFKLFFSAANKERVRQMTAGTAGYHALHAKNVPPTAPNNQATNVPPTVPHVQAPVPAPATVNLAAAASTVAAPPWDAPRIVSNLIELFYCWTHGLCTNPLHTSGSCTRPREGHQITATAANMMGGNNTIVGGGNRNRRQPRAGAGGNHTTTN
jgi:hypothetical protein